MESGSIGNGCSLYRMGSYTDLSTLNNSEVADIIIDKLRTLPHGGYASVHVDSGPHSFPFADGPLQTRLITIYRGKVSTAWAAVTAFFYTLGHSKEESRQLYTETFNGNKVRQSLCHIQNANESSGEEGISNDKECDRAIVNAAKILVRISNNCQYAEVEISDMSLIVQNSYALSRFIKELLTRGG